MMEARHEYLDGCEFCAIARGSDRSVEVVCESDGWIAFFPLDPATPGHTLVVPKTHVANFWQLDGSLATELTNAVIRVGRAIDRALSPEGMNLITSAGRAAEQSVFHLHLHVVPRWQRDGFGDIWPHGQRYEDANLDDAAGKIRAECKVDLDWDTG
jgi:histidine triad (HIT) family protein